MKLLALSLLPITLAFLGFPVGEKFKAGEKITVTTTIDQNHRKNRSGS